MRRWVSERVASGVRIALVGVLLPLPASAQTIVESMVGAYNSNADLLSQRARLRQVDEGVSQAVANWRPTLRVTADVGQQRLESSTSRDPKADLTPRTASITLTQPLYRGGRTTADTNRSEAEVRAERAVLKDREQTALLAAVTAHSDLVRDLVTVELRRNNVRVLAQQLEATQARFRVGELTRTDVAQSEARLAGAQSELTAAESAVWNSRANYTRVVGAAPPPNPQEGQLMGTIPTNGEEVVSIARDAAPRTVTAAERVASANHSVDLAFGELLPTLQAVGQLRRAHDTAISADRVTSGIARLELTVPLYQSGAEYSRVRAAKQLYGQRQIDLDGARRLSAETATRAYVGLVAARARIVSLDAQVQANQVALGGVRQEALVGSRTTLDVLNAEQELLNSQVNAVSARRDMVVQHYTTLAELGRLTARELNLPVDYYDEEKYYKNVRDRWIGLSE